VYGVPSPDLAAAASAASMSFLTGGSFFLTFLGLGLREGGPDPDPDPDFDSDPDFSPDTDPDPDPDPGFGPLESLS
jgi:hypothetical protein